MAPKKGQKYGDWRLISFLGEGGNGFVWLAMNTNAEKAAIKILAKLDGKNKKKVYARFKSEVNVVRANQDIDGLLPILDFYLPDEISDDLPWYAMPVAQPLRKYIEGANFTVAVKVIMAIGEILIRLHEKDICHRDIKPANILVIKDKFYLGDFGLVDYPEKEELTSLGDQIGANSTMAPELKRFGPEFDGKAADVYSLAKTLWILFTGKIDGFDGQYDPVGIHGLNKFSLCGFR